MPSVNTPYVSFLKNENFLKKLKEQVEEKLSDSLNSIRYTFMAHVKPDKAKIDIDREFYVLFTLAGGKVEHEIVYDTKPKKLKVGWGYGGEPVKWKKFIKTGLLGKNLKGMVKASQFQKLNMDAINQLTVFFFGEILRTAVNFNFIEGEEPIKQPEKVEIPEEEREIKPPEQLRKEIEEIIIKINSEGWSPALSRDLAWNYFNLGDLDKAETEFFKFFDKTKSTDIPSFIFCKIAAVTAEKIDIVGGGGGLPDGSISINLSKEELMETYEEAKKNYLKKFQ